MKGTITHSYPYFKKGDDVSVYEVDDNIGKALVMNITPKSYGHMKKDWVYMDHILLNV